MRHRGLDPDDHEVAGLQTLAAQLTKVERRRLAARQEERHARRANHGRGAHLDADAIHGSEMALLVLEDEYAVAARHKGCMEAHRPLIEPGTSSADLQHAGFTRRCVGESRHGDRVVDDHQRSLDPMPQQ